MPKKSKVWLRFIKVDQNKAKCNICAKDVAAKDGNTTNLMTHLTIDGINLKAGSCTVFDCKKEPLRPLPRPALMPVSVHPFTLAEKGTMPKEKQDECHNFTVKVLQLKLQQRKSRQELVKQEMMPPLKSSAAFHEQRRSLERARTEDYLKRKIRSRPEQSELIRMHILEEMSAEPSLRAKHVQLKRARLVDGLNNKISHRPGPMDLIHKNILPIHCSIKQAIRDLQFQKTSEGNSSCDEDSNCSLSPEQPVNQECPFGLQPLLSPLEMLVGNSIPSPTQLPPPVHPLPPTQRSSSSLPLTNEKTAQVKLQPKPNCEHFAQRHKKPKEDRPKIKKLKYHQYIPPDQKGDKEPPSHLDSSYAKILQQQQLFLQLQILNQQQQQQQQQQQKHSYHAILPAPPKPLMDQQQPPSSSSSNHEATCSAPQPPAAPSGAVPNLASHGHQSSAPLGGATPASLPPNLDWMKVAELKLELKLRSLPVSGTKSDLIERLRTYQELNVGGDSTASPTAGGTTGPGAEGTGNNTTQQQLQLLCHQKSLTAHPVRGTRPAPGSIQQPSTGGGAVSPPAISLPTSDHPVEASSSEDSSFNSDILEEMASSPVAQLSLQPRSPPQLPISVKEEPRFSTPTPCQFPIKKTPPRERLRVSPGASAAPVLALDKDKMLKEKDQQIEELTRMLRQKQILVEALRRQLELGKNKAKVPELVKVKQEPSENSGGPPSVLPNPPSSCEVGMVTIKQEVVEVQQVVSKTTLNVSPSPTLDAQMKSKQKNSHKNQQLICLQQSSRQFVQRQAIQKLLQQQQRNVQSQHRTAQSISQKLERCQNLENPSQMKKRKCLKQQLQQPTLQNKQRLLLQQQKRQQDQILHAAVHRKQQEVPSQAPQESQTHLNQQLSPSLPLDLLKSNSTPALLTDSKGNRFLISLTSHVRENAPEKDGRDDDVGRPVQDVSHGFSARGSLQPALKAEETPLSGKRTLSPSTPVDLCPGLDVLFSALSPASIKSAASSPDRKGREHEDDFIDTILQAEETSTTLKPDPFLDHLHLNSSTFSPPPSPPHLLLPPPALPGCDAPQSAPSAQAGLQTRADPAEEKHHLRGAGRLEDFLESTTGAPLLGVEPGGPLTLIDDLHSQMLCTPSILDPPPSPMDTSSVAVEAEAGLNSMDWFDLSIEGEEVLSPGLLGPPTPCSMFSTDFLDSQDLEIHWDV